MKSVFLFATCKSRDADAAFAFRRCSSSGIRCYNANSPTLRPTTQITCAGKTALYDVVVGDEPMGQAPPHRRNGKLSPSRRDIEETDADEAEVGALMKENAELRRLVIQLSKLVIKNAMLHR